MPWGSAPGRKRCYQHWPRVRNIGHGRLAIRSSRPAGSVRPAPGRQYQKSPSEREQIRNSSRPGRAPGPWPMLAIWPMLVAMLPTTGRVFVLSSLRSQQARRRAPCAANGGQMAGAERRPYQSSGMYSLSAAIAAARDTREHEDKLRRASWRLLWVRPLLSSRWARRRD